MQAKEVTAIEVRSGEYLFHFVEEEEWNGLVKFRCLSPANYSGRILIAMPDTTSGLEKYFSRNFGRMLGYTVVLASPELAALLKQERKVLAHRYLDSDGNVDSDWVNGAPGDVLDTAVQCAYE